ncbi:MAG: low molecular weight phosphotyrosine protein phosphatase [Salinisphaera sp.]|nr:low molecular weight phosphotyrosine protein phosphatase [Salinisphaera sp.]
MIRSILTVCTGNICRSPLAEALLQERLPDCTVTSAGIGALVGRPAEPHACTVAIAAGLDLSTHRARQATPEVVAHQDLILVLDAGHLRWMGERFPPLRGRVYLLGHWLGQRDVADPFRADLSRFQAAFDQIQEDAECWVERIAGVNA